MKAKLSLLALVLGANVSALHAADELIISEYIEGSSNNKAIEIYNPTAEDIDLSSYSLKMYFNRNTSVGLSIDLDGVIESNGVFVVGHSEASSEIKAVSDQINGSGWFNGNDTVAIFYNEDVIDSIGKAGESIEWGSGLTSTKDNTLRRDSENLINDTDINDEVTLDTWLGFEKDDWSDLGRFNGEDITPPDPELGLCSEAFLPISLIQGSEASSPFVGDTVTTEGVVTNIQNGLKGFYIQATDEETDAEPATSEGIFVYTNSSSNEMNVGDRIRIQAQVAEFYGLTQLKSIEDYAICSTNNVLPAATVISLPVDSDSQFEAVEGMRVSFSHPLIVNDVYNLSRYGELVLGSERHFIPTQVAHPGEAALAVAEANAKDRIILDDGKTSQNPEVIPYPSPQLSANNSVRVGDSITELTAIMHYGFNQYRLMPDTSVSFNQSNPRTATPTLEGEGNINIASFNVLNYFNGNGAGGGFPTSRGADSINEFERQQAKIIAALKTINADVFGLVELENDGFEANSAIASIVDALNAGLDTGSYQFIAPNVSTIGTDEIAVGIIYRSDKVQPDGDAKILDSNNSPKDEVDVPLFNDSKNRPMLTQSFSVLGSQESFVVAVNHLKSKGSNCDSLGDPDLFDGQGNCNLTRSRAAQAMGQWLNTEFAGQQIIVLGDLNAYANELPLNKLGDAGFGSVYSLLEKTAEYSYVFRGESGDLDYILANDTLADNLIDATTWHINADEARALDYNEEFKSDTQILDWYSPDAYRSSDHDPIIVRLNFDQYSPFAKYVRKPRYGSARLDVELPESVVWGDIVELIVESVDTGEMFVLQQRISKRRAHRQMVPVQLHGVSNLGKYNVSAKVYANPNSSRNRDGVGGH
ncbi:ExeM/NucH family extracellular endonuclease [Shewanella sp. 202IG2-18]|uniref:ExeM/NucH family extracellular endonuclease n=1 Tax=Parashewanella hymeniacidonis TaxID=2807618 RepID=UPI00195F843A|nr:ExeM/NucH family extracellular endonuclease [Parashewanella hymeniacidonis]MBM7074549.1 ExeM/NucH family extracellular endonuclease [Parashewanella hymeniacidonis]